MSGLLLNITVYLRLGVAPRAEANNQGPQSNLCLMVNKARLPIQEPGERFTIVLKGYLLSILAWVLAFGVLEAKGMEKFVEEMESRKGFDRAMLNLTGHEVGFMLGAMIASSGKSCGVKPTQWLVLGRDRKEDTLVSVHCKEGPTDVILIIPTDPDGKAVVASCDEMRELGHECWSQPE